MAEVKEGKRSSKTSPTLHRPRETVKEARFLLAACVEKRLRPRRFTTKRYCGLEKRKFRAFPTWIVEGTMESTSGTIQKVDPGESGSLGEAGTTS